MQTAESRPSPLKSPVSSGCALLFFGLALSACAAQSPAVSSSPQAGAAMEASPAQPSSFAEPPAATYSPSSAEPVPQTVDEALAQLARAEKEIDLAGSSFRAKAGASAGAGAAQPPPPPPGSPTPLQQRSPAESEESRGQACFSACRALSSMTRATEHLCNLAGQSDSRCEDARSRLSGAHKRVTDACTCAPAD